MKIYLAGPMTGIPEFNFPAFDEAAARLREGGHEVFNPADNDRAKLGADFAKDNKTGDQTVAAQNKGFSLRHALRDDTQFICMEAEAIAMLPGWENSKGARAEHALAYALGHRIIYINEVVVNFVEAA